MICDIALEYYTCKSGIEWAFRLKDRTFTFWENLLCVTILLSLLSLISFKIEIMFLMEFLGATSSIFLIFVIPLLFGIIDAKKKGDDAKYIIYLISLILALSISVTYLGKLIYKGVYLFI